jgi:HEAT repeat protein
MERPVQPFLGCAQSLPAISHLIALAEDEADPLVAAEAVCALRRIGSTEAMAVVRRVAEGDSVVPRMAARVALGDDANDRTQLG